MAILMTPRLFAQNPADSYANGVNALNKEEYDVAIEHFTRVIAINESYGDAYIKRSMAYASKGLYDEAIKDLQTAVPFVKKDKSKAAELYYQQGKYFVQVGEYEKGIESFGEAVRNKPNDYNSYIERGDAYNMSLEYESAIKDYEMATIHARFALDTVALINYKLGEIKFKQKKFQEAIRYFNKAIDNNPDKSIENNPTLGKSYYWRARSYRETLDYKLASEDLNKALQHFTNDPETQASIYYTRAICKNKLIDRYGAIQDYSQAIEMYGDYTEAYFSRGLCYKQTRQYEAAIKDFSKVISLEDNNIRAYYEKAKAQKVSNKLVEAKQNFSKVQELDKTNGKYRPFIYFYLDNNKQLAINEMNKRIYEKASYRADNEYLREEFYRMACIQSLCGDKEQAFLYVDSSLALLPEADKTKWEIEDDELEAIKYTDRFKDLLAKYKVKYSLTPTLTYLVRQHVETRFAQWKIRGEYEKKADFESRMKRYNIIGDSLVNAAVDSLETVEIKKTNWKIQQISDYDPDAETFKITLAGMQELIVPIPIADAREFKTNYTNVVITKPDLQAQLDQWTVSHLEFYSPSVRKTFKYNSSDKKTYDNSQQYELNFGELAIDIPGVNTVAKPTAPIAAKPKIIIGKSDVDEGLPVSRMVNSNAIAVVIGNRDYSHAKPVDYAVNDAASIKRYLIEVAGFLEGNIIYKENATLGDFSAIFGTKDNYSGKLYNRVKPDGTSDIFVFYSGHGGPGLKDRKGYIVPVECDPGYLEIGGYPLDILYKNLAKVPAKSVAVVTDACFSGAVFENISPMVIKMDEPVQSLTNAVIINSSTGDQVSSWYNEQQHGMFTYYFLKAMQDKKKSDSNADNQLTYQEIYDYLNNSNEGVPYQARNLRGGIVQTPVIQGSMKNAVFIKY